MNAVQSSVLQMSTRMRQHAFVVGRITSNLSGLRQSFGRQNNFSINSCLSNKDAGNGFNSPKHRTRTLPKFIYLQNPVTWIMNKLDFRMLKTAWDPEFDEEEFKRGAKQVSKMNETWNDFRCCYTSHFLWLMYNVFLSGCVNHLLLCV